MPRADYLPTHSGMPTPALAPSSGPLDLTSIPAVAAFLANTPFASKSVTYLPGGTVNFLYRIHLLAPYEGSQTIILKHAQPFLKDWTDTAIEMDRQRFEVEAMTRVRVSLPSTLPIRVPIIHHFDAQNSVIIMEDCGSNAVGLEEFLCSDSAASPRIAEAIGTALGEFIGSMHEWSRTNPEDILDVFDKNVAAKEVSADYYYDRIVATLQKSDKYDLPVLADLEVDASDIQVISKHLDEYRSLWPLPHVPGRDVVSPSSDWDLLVLLLMGDLWHSNIMVSTCQQPFRLFILDWDLARTGLAGAEVGLFCAAMNFVIRGTKAASEPASMVLQSFIHAYSRVSNRDTRLAQDTLLHWGSYFIFMAPRTDSLGDSDGEVIRGFVREGTKLLVHSQDKDFLAESSVNVLLPK